MFAPWKKSYDKPSCCSVAQSCLILWSYGLQHARLHVFHYFLEFAQIHVHWVDDAIQPSLKQRYHSADKVHIVKPMVFPIFMYECEVDHKEGWALKNWCFQIVVLEKTLESPWHRKEIQLINSKGNKHWIFIGRTDAEASILWPADVRSLLIGKDSDARKDWGQKEKEVTEDWDGWMASLTQWTWVWANSGR